MALSVPIENIAIAEAAIADCLQVSLCATLTDIEANVTEIPEKVELIKSVLCAYTCKEKGMGELINALGNLTLADKGLVPGGGGASEGCTC